MYDHTSFLTLSSYLLMTILSSVFDNRWIRIVTIRQHISLQCFWNYAVVLAVSNLSRDSFIKTCDYAGVLTNIFLRFEVCAVPSWSFGWFLDHNLNCFLLNDLGLVGLMKCCAKYFRRIYLLSVLLFIFGVCENVEQLFSSHTYFII